MSGELPLSMSRSAGDLVFVSGQASVDEDGQIVQGTFEEEMRRSIDNVRSVLESQGLALSDVIRVTSYVRDPDNRARYNEIYREYFSEPFPARTTLTNCLPEELHFEIDVIAVREASN
jgi:2-iminobutanoate/2-iminopropanoate deaminase